MILGFDLYTYIFWDRTMGGNHKTGAGSRTFPRRRSRGADTATVKVWEPTWERAKILMPCWSGMDASPKDVLIGLNIT